MTAAFNSIETLDANACANFSEAKSRLVLSLTFVYVVAFKAVLLIHGQLAMDKHQRKHQIGLDLVSIDSSNPMFPRQKNWLKSKKTSCH